MKPIFTIGCRARGTRCRRRGVFPFIPAACLFLAVLMAGSWGVAATVTITNVTAPEGAMVMVPVTYAAPAENAPATVAIRLSYAMSQTKLEALEVVASPLLAASNKALDYELTDGLIAMVVFGGQEPVPDGTLLYLVLQLTPAAQAGNTLSIINVTTSGADSAAEPVSVQLVSGSISVTAEPGKHSADTTPDWSISLSELLRVIQLYNAGAYHCDALGEDGYETGSGDETCAPHDGDYAPGDWRISLSELLRIIQLYNAPYRMYHADATTEDGFAPGPFGYGL